MLYYTFKHLKGIGEKKERELWNLGILDWHDFEKITGRQLLIFNSSEENYSNILADSYRAIKEENADFFAQKLSSQDYYRIALTFPQKTLFLDIETTGLSRYYDTITLVGWSMNNHYEIYIKGADSANLIRALAEAKVIVTFNGKLFDLPFLKQEFTNLKFPLTHIDLRFLTKQFGLTGGQKKIEQILDIKRSVPLQNITGETAPLLWHEYCQGNWKALELLINYNYADIEGMKNIFYRMLNNLIEKNKIPNNIHQKYDFSYQSQELNISISESFQMSTEHLEVKLNNQKISLPKVKDYFLPTLNDLISSEELKNLKIVGIDLSGSEQKSSGWCLLEGNTAKTQSLKTDAEIIQMTVDNQPHLIAIDSPLSLPRGRKSVDDSDPARETYGIMREAERILKKRGINVYPCLIKSMQKLTSRGIALAQHFRSLGIPVIESYPGSAQDILRIPRKQVGLEHLRKGLKDFGIQGDFEQESVTHDELDAITSAIVGLSFWSGKFEGLGNEEEDYLIIPNPYLNTRLWDNKIVIGFSGGIAAGKTTASEFLASQGFGYGRFSRVLSQLLQERQIDVNRETLQEIGIEINQTQGQRWLCQQILTQLLNLDRIVIDGLRFPEDHAFFKERFGRAFWHIHLDISPQIRRERYIQRGGSHQEFNEAESKLTERYLVNLKSLADQVVSKPDELNSVLSGIIKMVN